MAMLKSSLFFVLGLAVAPLLARAQVPSLPEEQERWAKPRPEPITIDGSDWRKSSDFPNKASMIVQDGACMVLFRRFWDRSLSSGAPSQRPRAQGR
jgi:hypothetical protein